MQNDAIGFCSTSSSSGNQVDGLPLALNCLGSARLFPVGPLGLSGVFLCCCLLPVASGGLVLLSFVPTGGIFIVVGGIFGFWVAPFGDMCFCFCFLWASCCLLGALFFQGKYCHRLHGSTDPQTGN